MELRFKIPIIIVILMFSFAIACNGGGEDIEVEQEVTEELYDNEESQGIEKNEEEAFELSDEASYSLEAGVLMSNIGEHLIELGESIDDYNNEIITLEELKLYVESFTTTFEISYYPDFEKLKPTYKYEEFHSYLSNSMEYLKEFCSYLKIFLKSEDEAEMEDALNEALMKLDEGYIWLDKAIEEAENI